VRFSDKPTIERKTNHKVAVVFNWCG